MTRHAIATTSAKGAPCAHARDPTTAGRQARTLGSHAASARPMASDESSGAKWRPGTVTSSWFGQLRQKSLQRAHEEAPRLDVHEQLRERRAREPGGVGPLGLVDVLGRPVDGHVATQGEDRTARLAGLAERRAVGVQLVLAQLAQHLGRNRGLDVDVLLEDQALARRRAQRLEERRRAGREIREAHAAHHGLEVGDARHALGVAPRPVEAQHRAPVVEHEDGALAHAGELEPRLEVSLLLGEVVAVRPRGLELSRVAEADEVRRQAAAESGDVGDHVAPKVRRRRVPVEEHDRVAGPHLEPRHGRAEDGRPPAPAREVGGGGRHARPRFTPAASAAPRLRARTRWRRRCCSSAGPSAAGRRRRRGPGARRSGRSGTRCAARSA